MTSVDISNSSLDSGLTPSLLDISSGETENTNSVQGQKSLHENETLRTNSDASKSSVLPSTTDAPLSIPLGSLVELRIDFICTASPTEANYLKEFMDSSNEENQQVSVRGRLRLIGGIYQRSVAIAFMSVEAKHCDNQTCYRLQTDKGDLVNFRFELNPDVVTNRLPQLSLEIHSKRSQNRKLSIDITLEYLLKRLAVGMEYPYSFYLIDELERTCGRLNVRFRGGMQTDLENSGQTWTTVPHEPKSCILTVEILDLQAAGSEDKEVCCLANIWLSTTGKLRSQTVSSLLWRCGGATTVNSETTSVSLQVTDTATDIVYVGIYRYSTHERNELIGLGSFGISSLQLSTVDSNAPPVEHCVSLFSESASERGSVVLSLQTTYIPKEIDEDSNISFAATQLKNIAYPVSCGEMKCRFDVDILEVHPLPLNVSEGDSISIQLRIAQNNWKAELAPAKVATKGSKILATFGEQTHTVICWAAKDRSFPVLEVFVYLQRQRQPNRIGIGSRASLTTTSNLKRRRDRPASKGAQRSNEDFAPVLMATGSLNLSSFFSQQNASVLTDLRLDVQHELVEKYFTRENVPEKVSVLSRLRASSSQENNTRSPSLFGLTTHGSQHVKGDVCIHLLQTSGSVFRKANSLSIYRVSISSGSEEVISSWCSIDDTNTLSWNQHLALPVACTGSPVIHFTLYHRALGASSTQQEKQPQRLDDDQIIGYSTLPIFPSVLEEDHLLQLELPFGMPFDPAIKDVIKQGNDSYYYKRGVLILEMQFLPSDQPKSGSLKPSDVYELVIHRVRGNLQNSGTSQCSSGLVKHVFIEMSIILDRGGTAEELAVGTTGVLSLSQSGLTEVGEVVDLSNPLVAATLMNGPNNVLVGRIRDLIGNNYGRVHLPLRQDWKERLVNRKKQVWYPICVEADNTSTATTKDAVLMSLQVRQQNNLLSQSNELGKFHINVCEAILVSGFDSLNLMKLGKYDGASVQLEYTSTDVSIDTNRSRTRQSTDQNSNQHWCWENEWFLFSHTEESISPQDLRFSLQIGVQPNHQALDGILNLVSIIEDARLRRLDMWVPLHDQSTSDNATISVHLHVTVVYFPTIIGTLNMSFGDTYTFSESERMLHVEKLFYKCTIHETSYSSTVIGDESSTTDEMGESSYKRLRLPLNTRLDTTAGIPELVIQRMGVTTSLGEICLGVLTMNLLSISDLCSLTSFDEEVRERFTWCKFTDKIDRAKTTAVAKLRVTFGTTHYVAEMCTTGTTKTPEDRVASAEMFTIWKKLFYLLDENGNGYIDRKEFTNVFVDHLDDLLKSSDGQKLLQLLYGKDNNQDDTITPTQQQITALFSMMDTNHDNEIEWSEYLRFLQQRQQQFFAKSMQNNENPATDTPELVSTQVEQKRELRKKNREDQRTALSSSGTQLAAESNQDETLAENRDVKSRIEVLTQEPAAPKRPSKVSRREEKLLKLQYSNQEQNRLQQQITSLETILAIERRRYAELAADRQALIRSYQQLHLKHQNEIIQEQTKAKWMKQTIERQQQRLEEREMLRQNRNQASIVLQSTVRSRLEQKRYQGVKLQRANAAIAIQCMTRCVKAKKRFEVLQELDRVAKLRTRAASRMQRFIRFHLHRKERALLVEARQLSATILQKNSRRMIACSTWKSKQIAILKLQCWVRQRLATKHLNKLRIATLIVGMVVLSWFTRWKYVRLHTSTRKLQRWWRRTNKERSIYLERLEAVLCIQSAWKRRITRKWFEREWQRQGKFLSELEAAICIQAAWRGRQQRLISMRSRELPLQFEDDSVIEARLYDIVAIIEADAAASTSDVHNITNANLRTGYLCEPSSVELLDGGDMNALPMAAEEEQLKPKPNDVLATDDDTVILSVLNHIVEIVVNVDDNSIVESDNPNMHVSGADNAAVMKNPNNMEYLSDLNTGNRAAQDFVSENLEEAEAEVEDKRTATLTINDEISTDQPAVHLIDSDDSDLSIIQNVLEDIKDLVADGSTEAKHTTSLTLKISSEHEGSGQEMEQNSSSRPNDFPINAAVHEQTETDVSGDRMVSCPLNGEQLMPSSDEAVIDAESGAVNDANFTSDERPVLDQPNEGGGDDDLELIPILSEEPVLPSATENFATEMDNDELHGINNEFRDNDTLEATVESKDEDGMNPLSSGMNDNLQHDSATADNDAAFDMDTVVGAFIMNTVDSDENEDSDSENTGGSSIDSTDLMMEADAMAIIQDASKNEVTESSTRSRRTTRLDSSILLADLERLNSQDITDKS